MGDITFTAAQIYAIARQRPLQQSQMIEYVILGVPGGSKQGRFTWPDQPNLRYVFTKKIRVYTADVLPYSPVSGTPLITSAELGQMFATFYANDKNAIDQRPLLEFQNVNNFSDPFKWEEQELNCHVIAWNKSFVDITNNGLGNTTNLSVLLCVDFIDPNNLITAETQLQFADQAG